MHDRKTMYCRSGVRALDNYGKSTIQRAPSPSIVEDRFYEIAVFADMRKGGLTTADRIVRLT
jgi:hypothetical protein